MSCLLFACLLACLQDEALDASLREALITALVGAWKAAHIHIHDKDEDATQMMAASMLLLRKGAALKERGVERLSRELQRANGGINPNDARERARWIRSGGAFRAMYPDLGDFGAVAGDADGVFYSDGSSLGHWAKVLLDLRWVWSYDDGRDIYCCRLHEFSKRRGAADEAECNVGVLEDEECYLVIEGERFLVHKSIVSAKSLKMAAAIQFATLNQTYPEGDEPSQIEIPLESMTIKLAHLFVQHCYAGSIVSGLPVNRSECCRDLLDLAMVSKRWR